MDATEARLTAVALVRAHVEHGDEGRRRLLGLLDNAEDARAVADELVIYLAGAATEVAESHGLTVGDLLDNARWATLRAG